MMAGPALQLAEPAHHHAKWKSRPSDRSLLKIAGLSFTACAGQKEGGNGEGDGQIQYAEDPSLGITQKLLIYCAYCVVQCL